jgi:hypothetical protein
MYEEGTTKKITRWKPLSSRPKGRPKNKWEEDKTFKSWKSRVGRRAYEGRSNGRIFLS